MTLRPSDLPHIPFDVQQQQFRESQARQLAMAANASVLAGLAQLERERKVRLAAIQPPRAAPPKAPALPTATAPLRRVRTQPDPFLTALDRRIQLGN